VSVWYITKARQLTVDRSARVIELTCQHYVCVSRQSLRQLTRLHLPQVLQCVELHIDREIIVIISIDVLCEAAY
jgi:hypothetical protein